MVTDVQRRGNMQTIMQRPCPHCHGTGKKITNPCSKCNGDGVEIIKEKEKITIPKGVNTGQYYVIQGKGCEPNVKKGVQAINGDLILSLNNRGIPEMRISREYTEMFEDYTNNKMNQTTQMKEAVLFVKQKLDSAQWFIEAIKQRQETLQRTMETIISLQRNFFLSGDEASLRPMILKDVAERSGYDISTISRVSNSKYVQTNFGIYPLKYFFSESIQTDSGEEISTREVKAILKEYIEGEDKRKPLTDEELAALLKEKGYVIARRTVAKYREQLEIPVARLRKEI
jgi:RNA polymerase sigma-54 factor